MSYWVELMIVNKKLFQRLFINDHWYDITSGMTIYVFWLVLFSILSVAGCILISMLSVARLYFIFDAFCGQVVFYFQCFVWPGCVLFSMLCVARLCFIFNALCGQVVFLKIHSMQFNWSVLWQFLRLTWMSCRSWRQLQEISWPHNSDCSTNQDLATNHRDREEDQKSVDAFFDSFGSHSLRLINYESHFIVHQCEPSFHSQRSRVRTKK